MKQQEELAKTLKTRPGTISAGGNGYAKAASLAKSFAAGRFSSDEAGDNKAAANRATLWNKFNGD